MTTDEARARTVLPANGIRKGGVISVLLAAALVAACGGDPASPDAGGGEEDGGGGESDAGSGGDAGDPGLDAGPDVAPLFRNSVDLPDGELAMQALRLMGAPSAGGSGSCTECHAVTRQNIRRFYDITNTAWTTCFADLEVPTQEAAQAIVDCFQDDAGNYTATNLGVFSTGSTFAWFQFVFRRALGTGWETEYERFLMRAQQPPDPHPAFTQAEFDLLTEWFLRGTPMVESVLPPVDGPGECTPYVDASVLDLVADGAITGWSERNRAARILMHGCAGAAGPEECLTEYPRVTDTTVGAMWETPGTTQRLLFTVPYRSSYWTKSSADGRFVAHGGNNAGAGASIIDLERGVVIGADAAYDPGFFPDNFGFMFQGTSRGPAVCQQSILTTGTPTRITFRETGCSRAGSLGLYQHVGTSLDGGDYWVVNSLWTGDPGDATRDPDVMGDPGSRTTLRRLTNTGTGFAEAGAFPVTTPWEANSVVSPTMRLMVTQLSEADGTPLGYVLRRIDVTRGSGGTVSSVALPEVARYCYPGGKAAVSLDDRWIVTHHRATSDDAVDLGFTGPTDPAFTPYRGVSNVYLIDIATGERTRITNMQPGQRALFPHFRSDGWIYFLVRSGSSGATPEYIVASDAALPRD